MNIGAVQHPRAYSRNKGQYIGGHASSALAKTSKPGKIASETVKNHRKSTERANLPSTAIHDVERQVLNNPESAYYLKWDVANKFRLSTFSQLANHFEKQVDILISEAKSVSGKSAAAHERLLKLLGPHLKADAPEVNIEHSEGFYGKSLAEFKGLLASIHSPGLTESDRSEAVKTFLDAGSHVQQQKRLGEELAKARHYREVMQTVSESLRNRSYGWLFRIVSPQARGQIGFWVNAIGMLTMIATLPLMYEGLKQWLQSMKHPQDAAPQ